MKKAAFYSIMALVVVLGLTISMAVPVAAQGVVIVKDLNPDPLYDQDEYYVLDTIYYVINITNPLANLNAITLINIWDQYPGWDELTDDLYYFVEAGVDSPLVLQPGESQIYYFQHTIRAGDVEVIDPPVGDDYNGVRNRVFAQYGGEGETLPPAEAQHTTEVMERPVGGTAHPVSRLALLAPWIVLAGVMAGVAVFVWSRRAQARA